MEFVRLLLVVALVAALPAGVVILGVIAHRPLGAAWLRRRARLLGWISAVAWGGAAILNWIAPTETPVLSVVVPAIAMLCMVGYAIGQFGALRS